MKDYHRIMMLTTLAIFQLGTATASAVVVGGGTEAVPPVSVVPGSHQLGFPEMLVPAKKPNVVDVEKALDLSRVIGIEAMAHHEGEVFNITAAQRDEAWEHIQEDVESTYAAMLAYNYADPDFEHAAASGESLSHDELKQKILEDPELGDMYPPEVLDDMSIAELRRELSDDSAEQHEGGDDDAEPGGELTEDLVYAVKTKNKSKHFRCGMQFGKEDVLLENVDAESLAILKADPHLIVS